MNMKIVLGMSGGVDSSVCAYLLKKQHYDVIGLFMQNWDPYVNFDFKGHVNDNTKTCDAQRDFSDAKKIADKLKIKIYYTQFIKKYWDKIFKYVINEYKSGNTPNPDILCNKYIKFDEFIQYVKKHFNCEKIAMGHYAKVIHKNNQYYLCKSKCKEKDQTYFLCWLNQKQLACVNFPLGNIISKTKVRKIAHKQNLINWNKKDSTGICFIGERKFHEFLKNYIDIKKGNIVDIDTKEIVGKHDGISFYTIGQNKSLGLGGNQIKYYVCKKDVNRNILYVTCENNKMKNLSSTSCELINFNWINDNKQWEDKKITVKFRYQMKEIPCDFIIEDKKVILKYKPTLSVTPGQFAVLYCKNFCLGGGVINKIIK